MLQDLGLGEASTGDLVILAVAAAVGGTLLGIISDAIIGRRGFGVLGNGFVIDLGMVAAAALIHRAPWGLHLYGAVAITMTVLAGATLALLLFVTLKNLVFR